MKQEPYNHNKPTKEKVKDLKQLIIKLMGGFEILFICLTIGIISNYITNWEWIQELINICIIIFTVILIIIKIALDKKTYKEEQRGEQ